MEGSALYAERLGLETGFCTDPYSNCGRLTYELGRACRPVVDAGHASPGVEPRGTAAPGTPLA